MFAECVRTRRLVYKCSIEQRNGVLSVAESRRAAICFLGCVHLSRFTDSFVQKFTWSLQFRAATFQASHRANLRLSYTSFASTSVTRFPAFFDLITHRVSSQFRAPLKDYCSWCAQKYSFIFPRDIVYNKLPRSFIRSLHAYRRYLFN